MTTDADAPKVPGYRITGPLRSAGAGRTFRARRAADGLPVLVRVLSGAPGPGGIFGGSSGGPGAPFAVWPEAPEGSAAALVARGERPSPRDAVRAGLALAAALAPLHAAGWVHHGIHPRTVLLSGSGAEAGPGGDPPLPAGVPFPPRALDRDLRDHLPPEAWAGRPATPASDVYRAAGVLWALLTGRVPPAAEPPRGSGEEPPDPLGPGVPADLADLLRRALDPDPARRPAHADALTEALTAVARAHGWAPEAAEGREGEAPADGAAPVPPEDGAPAAGAAGTAGAAAAEPPAAEAADPGGHSPRAAEAAADRARRGPRTRADGSAADEAADGEETGVFAAPDPGPAADPDAFDAPGGAFAEPEAEKVVYFEEEPEEAVGGTWTAPVWSRGPVQGRGPAGPARADTAWGGNPPQARPDPAAAAAVRRAQWAAERAAEERAEKEDDDRDARDARDGDDRAAETEQFSPEEPFLGYRALPGAAHGAPLPLASPSEPAGRGPADRVVLIAALAVAIAAAAVALAVAAVVLVLGGDEEGGEDGTEAAASPSQTGTAGDGDGEGGAQESDRPEGRPRPPGDVEIAEDAEVSVVLTWTGHGGDDVYNIMGGPKGEPAVLLADTRPPAEEIELVGLNPDVDYCFTVVAVISGEETKASEEVCTDRSGGGGGDDRPTGD
ncbi:hypothetical protein [Streptomonospora nanhaiensis]|uniref:hypothetical protein n=1 Tax=Streptomonospora nanhaiensis TaxID=1323731 RepID=UPI001C381725|nr:hypothetical protein [Streptomonospora nanhaiensis]MBV2366090.1 hypothetical protein [Streptomonospora nanhaiensis]